MNSKTHAHLLNQTLLLANAFISKKGYIVTGTARSFCQQAISAVTPIDTPRHT
jgi:hypothetical protein